MTDVITTTEEVVIVDEVEVPQVVVIEPDDAPVVVETSGGIGPPGPIGPQGPAGSAEYVVRTAGEALGGHRVVIVNDAGEAMYADPTVEDHAYRVRGLTRAAVTLGSSIEIQTQGEMTEPSWTWTPGLPLFLVANGLLSHTPPSSGFSLFLGTALSPTTIFVKIDFPVFLE